MTKNLELPPRQRILEAVINCIEKEGINGLTTRKIADEAGTNIASINYYFRSKELLVAEALSLTLQHMQSDIDAIIESPEQPCLESLEGALFYILEGGSHFPGIMIAHLYSALLEKDYDTPGVKAINEVYVRTAARAIHEFPDQPQQKIQIALFEIFSSAIFTLLLPGLFQVPLDFAKPEDIHRLAADLTHLFIARLEL